MRRKNDIKIFYEQSKKVGHGHAIRSFRMYNIFKKRKFNCHIYKNKNNEEIERILNKNEKKLYLVLDYKNYKRVSIKRSSKIKKIFVIENLNKKKFHNSINIFPLDIQFNGFSGPSYLLYPFNFYKLKRTNFKFKKVPNILLIQGGTDANNNLNKILNILLNNKFKFKFKITVKTQTKNQIDKRYLNIKDIRIVQRVKSIDNILRSADLAISACGNSAFELGFLGVPTIHFTNEKREIIRAKIFEKKKIGVFCYPNNKKKLVNEINKLYTDKDYRKKLILKRIKYFRKKNLLIKLFK
jgi:spore coat polysaccharide biosynthesis predicted glycosyltransferase SpsG